MATIWNDNKLGFSRKSLNKNISTDVLIIGGGITGILTAYKLKKQNVNYVLLEGDKILDGNTGNTTAKITVGHGFIYHQLINKFDRTFAKKYYYANKGALEQYKSLSKIHKCDFQLKDLYVYSLDDENILSQEYKALRYLDINADLCQTEELPFITKGAIRYKDQGQFNPYMFLKSISKELNIYEHSFVYKIKGNTAYCKNGNVTFNKVIFATHFPIVNKLGLYFLKLYQHRSFVVALDNAPNSEGMYVDYDNNGYSFRNYRDYLIVSGGGAHTGKSYGGYNQMKDFVKRYYPNSNIKYEFAAQDCMSLDNVPYIGKLSSFKNNYYVATGFNAWGMTSSMIASDILCDMVLGKENQFQDIFSPQRSIFHSQLTDNFKNSIINLLTPTTPRCPHMGCALKWNKEEKTWDCPCHGSRFTKDGKLIDNPSVKNKKL